MRYSNVRVVARPNKKNRKPIIAACTSPSVGQVSYQALNRYGPKVGPMGWWGQSPKQPLYTNQGPNQELNCRHATTCSCNPQQAPPTPPTLAPQPTGGGAHTHTPCTWVVATVVKITKGSTHRHPWSWTHWGWCCPPPCVAAGALRLYRFCRTGGVAVTTRSTLVAYCCVLISLQLIGLHK